MATAKVPPVFPRTVPKCESQSKLFFTCFSKASEARLHSKEDDAGGAALRACASELAKYDKCMAKHMGSKERDAMLYRAPEPYRVRKGN